MSSTRAEARFRVTDWSPTPTDRPADGPTLTRVGIKKAFEGDLEATSAGEGLFCGLETPADGAGYLVSERVTGRLGGLEGTFVLQHGGIAAPGQPPQSFGHVVPGSGTGALAGIVGSVSFEEGHTLLLDYHLEPAP